MATQAGLGELDSDVREKLQLYITVNKQHYRRSEQLTVIEAKTYNYVAVTSRNH